MNLDEVMQWRPFEPQGREPVDLSFLDAHKATYIHQAEGKPDIKYDFWITYSFHCFAKDYPDLTQKDREALMYHAPKEARPFCYRRYGYAKKYLRKVIESLGTPETRVVHAGYGSYAAVEITDDEGNQLWYFVPFKVYKERKKFRLHVTSAYPLDERPGGGKVGFFTIVNNLRLGKPLPKPRK
ncbi:hypothetical protein [Oceanimonas smirnovii]|uniref:hypothetical protein n=1 Tax=Oceanimonas smirnovii TaxID=264574 RepID=UPI00376F994A